jgi:DNA-directed RNA polymerase subunit H (RpoH/RPB5)
MNYDSADRAIEICREMLAQRSYAIEDATTQDLNEFIAINATKPDGGKMCVFVVDVEKVNTECIQRYIASMQLRKISHSIIIYKDSITASARKNVKDLPVFFDDGSGDDKVENEDSSEEKVYEFTNNSTMARMKIEFFSRRDLASNITKHVLQPLFRVLPKSEGDLFKKKYGIKHPKIFTTDPIARFYGYNVGDVVEVTRKNGFVAYRIVKLA